MSIIGVSTEQPSVAAPQAYIPTSLTGQRIETGVASSGGSGAGVAIAVVCYETCLFVLFSRDIWCIVRKPNLLYSRDMFMYLGPTARGIVSLFQVLILLTLAALAYYAYTRLDKVRAVFSSLEGLFVTCTAWLGTLWNRATDCTCMREHLSSGMSYI